MGNLSHGEEVERICRNCEASRGRRLTIIIGWWMLSFALHEMKCTQEAYENLAAARDKFSGEWILHYNLACYLSRLGRLDEARVSLKHAKVGKKLENGTDANAATKTLASYRVARQLKNTKPVSVPPLGRKAAPR